MPSLKQIKRRISSIKNTQQITRAMKMVAAAKLRRAQENIIKARPYSHKLREVIKDLSGRCDRSQHPLLAVREPKEIGVVVITADRGFCGGFNTNIIKRAVKEIESFETIDPTIQMMTIGKKGSDYFAKNDYNVLQRHDQLFQDLHFGVAASVGESLIDFYKQEKLDRVYLIYNEFKSAIQQNLIVEQLLPIIPDEPEETTTSQVDFIYEPDPLQVLSGVLPLYVNVQMWRVFLESNAAEHGARMTAMENATNNANELIDTLTLTYNKARQAAITKELLEVVSGAEGLK
ncbi:ATP synthase F1 subunit gamma [candidate division LCP-89 bacterium B3_LCP]|uniref:ATP synthase gamma chain n=1 Tax=candidate division LCP-89 bacterium B3_LCP TaxID=2012998 RepID=A0A532UPR0_UNCL8|nr:MAG: ATP synthase F1 subunit gamma [candidate division LCP-89 bacterium B3_LCP]